MEEHLDDLPVELRSLVSSEFVQRLLHTHRLPVRPVGGHCVKGVRHRNDPCDQADVWPFEAVGIARAIVFFMVARTPGSHL